MSDDKSNKSEAQLLVQRWTIGFNVCLILVIAPSCIWSCRNGLGDDPGF